MKGTKIGRYNQLTTQAAEREREGELESAASLWREAAENATERHNPAQAEFCEYRAKFCDAALKRHTNQRFFDDLKSRAAAGKSAE